MVELVCLGKILTDLSPRFQLSKYRTIKHFSTSVKPVFIKQNEELIFQKHTIFEIKPELLDKIKYSDLLNFISLTESLVKCSGTVYYALTYNLTNCDFRLTKLWLSCTVPPQGLAQISDCSHTALQTGKLRLKRKIQALNHK